MRPVDPSTPPSSQVNDEGFDKKDARWIVSLGSKAANNLTACARKDPLSRLTAD